MYSVPTSTDDPSLAFKKNLHDHVTCITLGGLTVAIGVGVFIYCPAHGQRGAAMLI
jgi:hypothetical protein